MVADAQSRCGINAVEETIDMRRMELAQPNDDTVQALWTASNTMKRDDVPLQGNELTLLCDVSTVGID